ncbi:MAG: prephenate dehydratase [Bacteroidales bacterium]|nr:prephenate dehydratase [Bacteroidales bacterium]
MSLKVAIQGISGAFHEEAAAKYYKTEHIDIVPCKTFSELIEKVETGKADTGIMAIENTIAGSILPNYDLIRESNLLISGEIYLRIIQNLIAKADVKLSEIKEVISHPMAIYQCSNFFQKYPEIKLIESFDTALSVKETAENSINYKAAIASSYAAKRYKLKIIAESIENNKLNYTRFFEIKKESSLNESAINKASVNFSLSHKTGSLASVLSVFAFYDINLQKIQSYPVIGTPGRYSFYIDIIFDDYERYKQSLNAVTPLTTNFYILGEYKSADKSFNKIHKS